MIRIVSPQLSRRVTTLINKTNVRNDFKGKTAGGKELQQYRLTLPEMGPLKAKVTKTYKLEALMAKPPPKKAARDDVKVIVDELLAQFVMAPV